MSSSVMVGCDPHKVTMTVAAVDAVGAELGVLSVANDAAGIAEALEWMQSWGPLCRVGIEGSAGHGHHFAEVLVAAGLDVREVPSRRTAQRRRDRRRPKTDREDALAIAREVAGDSGLGPCRAAQGIDAVRQELAVVEAWRTELVQRRKRILNYSESLLGGLPVQLVDRVGRTGKVLARLRRAVRLDAGDPATAARLAQLAGLLTDHDRLSSQIRALDTDLRRLVAATGTTLCDETGIGITGAARLLVQVGDPTRFRSESHFARWCGVAAVAVSSGEGDGVPTRHRLDLGGNRQINSVMHLMSVVQGRHNPDARTYLDRKRREGKTFKEARRAHKRQLANRVIRRMWNDATPAAT